MLIGWGGNNGSTVTATVLANKLKLKWETKEGVKVRWEMFTFTASGVTHYTRENSDA